MGYYDILAGMSILFARLSILDTYQAVVKCIYGMDSWKFLYSKDLWRLSDERNHEICNMDKGARMNKRETVRVVLEKNRPPYVPWSFKFTKEATNKLVQHYGNDDLERMVHNHILRLGNDIGFF